MSNTETNKIWLKNTDELLSALLADEAKAQHIITETQKNLNQLSSKSKFRLALINELINNNKGNQ